ncbi:LysR family transcriptional regulator [Shewanella sp. Choline-02u-19]|uniref:LysR family transcriptional regulator n=1 Tax=unclassified Shewanella TaxID=196818 RepID=UPI000C31F015|nr:MULTISPECIES: LysR family transcriptional regulator [unclassified Shewanella]PKG76603.1 LysR family transcriptional regulator [Shewanella sp. GutCb]PKH56235.1 LysR family transcriptional regulator [Shewanella sp. Bg11-22]PKI28695.1 LysR family transcriptional regulator [Shewanella sp. Choline-02u-19]
MDLKTLYYFVEVVNAGGFSKASKTVFLTQPALSKAIRLLEEELQMVLLERGKRGTQVKLTAAGQVVYRHAEQLLSGRQRMLAELDGLRNLTGGTLRLGLAPLGSAELFAPAIAKFRQDYPKIEMQLLVRGGIEQTAALKKDDIELATGIIDFDDEFDGLRIRNEPMVVVVPKSHPLASKKQLQLNDLRDQAQVMFEREYTLYEFVLSACEKVGFAPTEITRVSHADFGIALVAAGTGVMLLPQIIAERYRVDAVVNVPLASRDLRWELSLFWRKQQTLSFAAKAMIEIVKLQLIADNKKA